MVPAHPSLTTRYPLAAFERYMLLDDQPDYSMTCHIRFWFAGELHRPTFEAALKRCLERHPLLSSRLQYARKIGVFRRPVFEPIAVCIPEILDWSNDFDPYQPSTIGRSDMRVKFLVRTCDDHSLLAVKFHHAITDGIGVFQFMEDLMLLYDEGVNFTSHRLPALASEKLHRRVTFGLSFWDWLNRLHLDAARLTRFFNKLPTPLASMLPASERQRPSDPAAAVRMVIPFENVSSAQSEAKSAGLTFNELMIGRLLRACLAWNRAKGGTVKSWRPFRMNVPVSLRTPDEDDMPSANYVSMVFLDRMPKEIDQEASLIRSMADEMSQVKRDRMGLTLIMAVSFLMRLKVFGTILRSSMCMTSIGLTNLGQPFRNFVLADKDGLVRTGNVTLLGLDTFPPVRRNTLATLSVNRYGGKLSMTVRYDSTRWSSEHAGEFLRSYLNTLTNQPSNLTAISGLVARENGA